MAKSLFEMHFFNELLLCEYKKDEIIFDEGDKSEYFYFIKTGEIEISIYMSMLDLNHFIQEMSKTTKFYNMMKEGYVLKSGKFTFVLR